MLWDDVVDNDIVVDNELLLLLIMDEVVDNEMILMDDIVRCCW